MTANPFFTCKTIVFILVGLGIGSPTTAQRKPNVILIYADDLGYGDAGCYGSVQLKTPQLDRLANQGIRFTNAHTTSATCTPSRYALMTGQYPWRTSGTGVLPGDAALVIPQDKMTLASLFQKAGYATGIVGKWHLGLGDALQKDWNGEISPGPNDVGFGYSFIFPATADRVPTVFLENQRVLGVEPSDPIAVDYQVDPGSEPTGRANPELLKMRASPKHGHDFTIVNGIGRIGYMKGGRAARWTDEELPLTFLEKSREFIQKNRSNPFFLLYSLTEPHVPRMPSTMFKGKSGLGYRGDAILQLDWAVGQIMDWVELLGIARNTIILFSSDNGPVLDDGYEDGAVTMRNGHTPWGPLRGGKYSAFEAGTRVPFILSWPGKVRAGTTSEALLCQMDLLASFARLLQVPLNPGDAPDSEDMLQALLGKNAVGRQTLVKQGFQPNVILHGNWKYIEPNKGAEVNALTNIELGNRPFPQLYNLSSDIGERENLAERYPEKVAELAQLLERIRMVTKGQRGGK